MLNEKSSIKEVFDYIRPEQGVQVVPTRLTAPGEPISDFMIIVSGQAETANVIFARLMSVVDELHEMSEQAKKEENSAPKLVVL